MIKFSPFENVVAVGTETGVIVVWELNFNDKKKKERMILVSTDHRPEGITQLQWDEDGWRLFSADMSGKVISTQVNVGGNNSAAEAITAAAASSATSLRLVESTKNMFRNAETIFTAESQIVQIDFKASYLLVSTLSRCHILDTKNRTVIQVGKKLRDGPFGACFRQLAGAEGIILYAARPGTRIWEADISGSVLSTANFKQAFAGKSATKIPSLVKKGVDADYLLGSKWERQATDVADLEDGGEEVVDERKKKKSGSGLQFGRVCLLPGGFMLSWSSNHLFVLDVGCAIVLGFHDQFQGIEHVSVSESEIFVMHRGLIVPGHVESSELQRDKNHPLQITKLAIEFPLFMIKRALKMKSVALAFSIANIVFENFPVESFCKSIQGDVLHSIISALREMHSVGEGLMSTERGDANRNAMIARLEDIIASVKLYLGSGTAQLSGSRPEIEQHVILKETTETPCSTETDSVTINLGEDLSGSLSNQDLTPSNFADDSSVASSSAPLSTSSSMTSLSKPKRPKNRKKKQTRVTDIEAPKVKNGPSVRHDNNLVFHTTTLVRIVWGVKKSPLVPF